MNKIEKLKEIITSSKNIVFITGAGISTPSGIPDIRGKNGAMNNTALLSKYKHSYEEIVSHSFFMAFPEQFYNYHKNEMIFENAKPNIAHKWIKDLEQNHNVTIITQNIDGLHFVAGSKHVIEFHGTVQENTCLKCGKKFDLNYILASKSPVFCDKCGGLVKPDVVLFEEGIDEEKINDSLYSLKHADTLIVIGSSLVVYPAAALPNYFEGKNFVIINKDPTPLDKRASLVINDDILSIIELIK